MYYIRGTGIGTFSLRMERHDLNSPQGSHDARIYGLKRKKKKHDNHDEIKATCEALARVQAPSVLSLVYGKAIGITMQH